MTTAHQCVSPSKDQGRCSEIIIVNSHFCKMHSDTFLPLYLQYKKLEKKLKFLIQKTPIKVTTSIYRLLKLHSCVYNVYKERIAFRKKAFVPEAWDDGHKLRIFFLWKTLEKCNNVMTLKFHEDDMKQRLNNVNNIKLKQEQFPVNNLETVIRNIQKKQKKIYNVEKEFNTVIPYFIKEKEERKKMMYNKFYEHDSILQKELNVKYTKNFLGFLSDFGSFFDKKISFIKKRFLVYTSNVYDYVEITKTKCLNCEKCLEQHLKITKNRNIIIDLYFKIVHNIYQLYIIHKKIKYRIFSFYDHIYIIFPELEKDNIIILIYVNGKKHYSIVEKYDGIMINIITKLLGEKYAIIKSTEQCPLMRCEYDNNNIIPSTILNLNIADTSSCCDCKSNQFCQIKINEIIKALYTLKNK